MKHLKGIYICIYIYIYIIDLPNDEPVPEKDWFPLQLPSSIKNGHSSAEFRGLADALT